MTGMSCFLFPDEDPLSVHTSIASAPVPQCCVLSVAAIQCSTQSHEASRDTCWVWLPTWPDTRVTAGEGSVTLELCVDIYGCCLNRYMLCGCAVPCVCVLMLFHVSYVRYVIGHSAYICYTKMVLNLCCMNVKMRKNV